MSKVVRATKLCAQPGCAYNDTLYEPGCAHNDTSKLVRVQCVPATLSVPSFEGIFIVMFSWVYPCLRAYRYAQHRR